jgi:hypothetical protein
LSRDGTVCGERESITTACSREVRSGNNCP